MWPWGHAAVGYLLYRGVALERDGRPPTGAATLWLLLGTQFPDLVDKPLAWYLGVLPTGRSLAHSLLLLVPVAVATLLLARHYDRTEYGAAFVVGALSHVAMDSLPSVVSSDFSNVTYLLWPALAVQPYEGGAPTILELFVQQLGSPLFLSEFVFLALALVAWWKDGRPGVGSGTGRRGAPAETAD